MSVGHHGDGDGSEINKIIRRFVEQGHGQAPREYPDGRMGAGDEGSLAFLVRGDQRHGTVILEFNKPVAWLGMSPEDAVKLAATLVAHARRMSNKPLVFDV